MMIIITIIVMKQRENSKEKMIIDKDDNGSNHIKDILALRKNENEK